VSPLATDIFQEHAALQQQVAEAENRAAWAEAAQRKAERQLKQVEIDGGREQQKLAKQCAESAVALLTAAIAVYIGRAENPQHARQRLQNYLSARIVPALGAEVPAAPWGTVEL
jgi:hypothetical protein